MATLIELYVLGEGSHSIPPSTLFKRVVSAVAVVAQGVLGEDPATPEYDTRRLMARAALRDPATVAQQAFWRLLSENSAFTPAQIESATDAALIASVQAAFNSNIQT